MNIICPCCQAIYPIEAALNDVAGRQAIVAAFGLTSFGDLLVGYTRLFTPPKRALSNVRLAKLIEELIPMIREAKVTHKGRIWSAPQTYWKMGLEDIIERRDTLILPLKGHGYLIAIIAGYSNKAEAKQESQTNAQRGGHTQAGSAARKTVDQVLGPESNRPRSKMPESVLQQVGLDKKTGGNDVTE